MKYAWDEKKQHRTMKKHGIRFEEAQVIWSDPNSLEFIDEESGNTDPRFIRIGLNPNRGILLVVYCERDEGGTIRIISTRKATLSEKNYYEKEL